jgi:hypothetical protein
MPDIDTSKLEAVNTMLSLIGEAAVNSLTTNLSADVALAIRTLDEQDRQLQLRGWNWNTDHEVSITPDSDGRYVWQTDWIRFDVDDQFAQTDVNIERRGGYLWNAAKNTDVFTQGSFKGTLTRYIDWDDMPERARNYVMVRSARIFLTRTLGDESRAGYAIDDERHAKIALEEAETEQAEYNILTTGVWPQMQRRRRAW